MAVEIRLIATDLDGTLIGSANDFPLYTSFNERVNEMRAAYNASWVACTGRTYRSFTSFFYPMRTMGLAPDYVVTAHSFIYQLTRFGYMPHLFWDVHILFLIWQNRWHARDAIDQWHQMMVGGSLGVTTIRRRKDRLWLRFDSEDAAQTAAALLEKKMTPHQHLKVFTKMREVEVRSVPFTKGLAVAELARHLGCGPDTTLTIGNGHNDLSMLQVSVAEHMGCPSNSEPEVLKAVHEAGGHVAKTRALAGVMEILEAYLTDTVSNDLPRGWCDPPQMFKPRRRHRDKAGRGLTGIRWGILLVTVYVVLLVMANFDVLPFGGIIMKPWRWSLEQVTNFLIRL